MPDAENPIRREVEAYLEAAASGGNLRFQTADLELHVQKRLGMQPYSDGGDYPKFAEVLQSLIKDGRITPVKASGRNGRVPSVANRHQLSRTTPSRHEERRTLAETERFPVCMAFDGVTALMKKERDAVRALATYLTEHPPGSRRCPAARNERSFEIFGHEKFLEWRPTFLGTLGLSLASIDAYETFEPFVHRMFAHPPKHALVVENATTYCSIQRLLDGGHRWRWGPGLDLLIFGSGDKFLSSHRSLALPDFRALESILYFGDIDSDGVELLAQLREREPRIQPAALLYEAALLGLRRPLDPRTSKRKRDDHAFASAAFRGNPQLLEAVTEVLTNDLCIPQETLALEHLIRGPEGRLS